MTTSQRTLVSTRRRVSEPGVERYEKAWGALRKAADTAGAKAWRFRAAENTSLYIEFWEFRTGEDPRQRRAFRDAAARLHEIAPGDEEEWQDADSAQ